MPRAALRLLLLLRLQVAYALTFELAGGEERRIGRGAAPKDVQKRLGDVVGASSRGHGTKAEARGASAIINVS